MSFFKKFYCLFVVLAVMLSLFSVIPASAEGTSLSLFCPEAARPGDTVIININVSGLPAEGITSFKFDVKCDFTKLSYVSSSIGPSISKNDVSGGGTFQKDENGIDVIRFNVSCSNPSYLIPNTVSSLGSVSLVVKDTAPAGNPVSFSISGTENSFIDGKNPPETFSPAVPAPVSTNILEKLSNDATLSSLSVKDFSLNTPFLATKLTGYSVTVPYNALTVAVNTATTHPDAKVKVTGNTNLKPGLNTVRIVVTAPDSKTQKTYTITVTKDSEPISSAVTSVSSQILPSPATIISEPTVSSDVPSVPVDDLTTLQKKYEQLEEKLYVVIVLFIIVIAALLCYIIYLLIKARN